MLWGGLALFIAVLLPLLFVGRRSLLLSAVLAGIGVGLFIDEVGELLAFYAAQFTALAGAVWGVILLGLVLDLRVRERMSVDVSEAQS